MKAEQVDQALRQKFIESGERIVFWDDPDGEFADYIAEGLPEGLNQVTIVDLSEESGLATKLRLEREDPTGRYLLYAAGGRVPAEEDWLLDIRIYGARFSADVASIWLKDLGLNRLSLLDHLRERSRFLGNQERRKRLGKLIAKDDDEADIDLKMMAVIAGTDAATLFSIVSALAHGHCGDGEAKLSEHPESMEILEKMGLHDRFWSLVEHGFGYSRDEPSFAGLIRCLFVSDFVHQLEDHNVDALTHFSLPPLGRQNAAVCLAQWRDSSERSGSYDAIARAVGAELNIHDILSGLPPESLSDVFTFWEAERRLLAGLKNRVLEEKSAVDPEAIGAFASQRKAGHWLSGPGRDEPPRAAAAHAYDAILAASELFALKSKLHPLAFETPQALLTAYQNELYRFDQLYRRFTENAAPAEGQGWDLLKTLSEEVEALYDQDFLQPLGLEWSRLLDDGFLDLWHVPAIPAQRDFFSEVIRPYLDESDRKRAYVIISDAFRYEAAQDLTQSLNGLYRMDAELSAMLGVLPSYTSLGMASLLPGQDLAYTEKGDVAVDGDSVTGTEARNKQLEKVGGMACRAEELRVMKLEEAREFTRGKRVVYVYHNVIDARGDSASTESETFSAVDECIKELVELVQFCVNKLNAATVWVTADHGFLFQKSAPGLTDKTALVQKPDKAVKVKKRYVIGRSLGAVHEAHHGYLTKTAKASGDMEFWVPRGPNRFHFSGGARFVHGGAMPQEIVVPLVTVKQLRGKKKAGSRSEKVSIQVLGSQHKITTPVHRFEFIQTEAVSERRKPVTVRAAVYDGARPVTSIETAVFDSSSDRIEERKRAIRVELASGEYDKAKPYRLVLRDAETEVEVLSVPVVIDRSFADDF